MTDIEAYKLLFMLKSTFRAGYLMEAHKIYALMIVLIIPWMPRLRQRIQV